MATVSTSSSQGTGKPVSFGVVLFPGFQALDAFGPLDAFNILSRKHKMNLSVIAPSMEPVSTKTEMQDPGSAFEQLIQPTHTYENAPPLDVLLVPGGPGTRQSASDGAVEFIRKTFPSLQYLITVCTGSQLAAKAGVLDGKKATTNKLFFRSTTEIRKEVDWIRKARWVRDGHIWTSSGISAGIDVTFAWIEEVYGADTAQGIADRMEYTRATDPDNDPFADLPADRLKNI
jgi:transcriptional regulator GlxA family with amidase domain